MKSIVATVALNFCLTLAAPAAVTVLDYYRLGEDDPGAFNGGWMSSTRDSVGTNNLTVIGGPFWSSDVSGAASFSTASVFSFQFFQGGPYCIRSNILTSITDNFGIEAWVKPAATSGNRCIAYNGNTAANGWGLYQIGSTFQGLFGGVGFIGSGPVTLNGWTHVALVRSNGVARLYVNGVAAGSSSTSAPHVPSGSFAIAAKPQNPAVETLAGLLDEVRIFTFAPGHFTTSALLVNQFSPPPTILGESATGVTGNSATLNATVNPRGESASVYFEYGTTTNYGSLTSGNNISGSVAIATSASATGLLPNTLYHFLAVAGNSVGTTVGSDLSFTTPIAAPQTTTLTASNISNASAVLNASVNPGAAVTSWYFQYGTTTNYSASTPTNAVAAGTSTVFVNSGITGLNPGTLYHFRVIASNAAGSSVGSDLTFTSAIASPQATTLAASNIAATNATLNGSINPGGGATSFYFQYGTTANYGMSTATNTLAAGTSTVVTNMVVTGLSPGTLYHFRVAASNAGGSQSSFDVTFTTPIAAPQPTTLPASNLTATNATLNASINPGGGATSFYFQYGTTTNYGTSTPTNILAAGTSVAVTNSVVSGLNPGTVYHFRVVAGNAAASSVGSDLTFTTLMAPQAATLAANNITSIGAALNASVNPGGAATSFYFQYGTTTNYGMSTATNTLAAGTNTAVTNSAVTGLDPGTLYHFRVVASNTVGIGAGSDLSFTTLTTSNLTVTTTNDAGSGSLRAAILGSALTATINFAVTGTISLATSLPMITNNLTISGPGASLLTISGAGSNRVFFIDVANQSANLSGFTVANGQAKGGDGGTGFVAGGGGLGAGGAIFVNAGALTLSNVFFNANSAIGGTGGDIIGSNGGGGGGGFGGDGGNGTAGCGGGGGGFAGRGGAGANINGGGGGGGLIADGGDPGDGGGGGGGAIGAGQSASSAAGGVGGDGGGGDGGNATRGFGDSHGTDGFLNGGGGGGGYGMGPWGYFGGNGGKGGKFGGGGGADRSAHGGDGGDFGGGGGCTGYADYPGTGGNGGFGGGGGGGGGAFSTPTGNGGFGGGGAGKTCSGSVPGGSGGAFGGRGGAAVFCNGAEGGSGGGGAALGGAIFVRGDNGATLTWIDCAADAGTLVPGAGGLGNVLTTFSWPGDPGQVAGSALFLIGSSNVFTVTTDQQSINGSISGWSNSPASLIKQGAGTLILAATNTFPGGSFVNAGTLRIDGDHSSSSNLVVNAGGTIAGTGTVGVLTMNTGATLSPGASPGRLSAGNTTWSGAGNYNWQLYDATGSPGSGSDLLSVNGTLDVSAASGFEINLWTLSSLVPETSGSAINFNNTRSHAWALVQTTGGIIGFNPTNFIVNISAANGTAGFANSIGTGHFALSVAGNNLVLSFLVPPIVTAQTANPVAGTSATLNGTVDPAGLATTWYFQYGTPTNYGSTTATNTLASTANALSVASSIGGLTPGTLYHFSLVASNSAGISTTADAVFNTPVLAPAVVTQPVSGVTASNATLNASINPGGGTTSCYFQYGFTTNYGSFTVTNSLAAGANSVAVSNAISVLPGTLYHVRAVAANSAGLATGADLTFATPSVAPTALTQAATGVTTSNATLNALVNPGGATTSCSFQYGLTTNYGSFTATNNLAAGANSILVSNTISGLVPGMLYHARVLAGNSIGNAAGADITFTTPVLLAAVLTQPATAITSTNAMLNASINPGGGTTSYCFQYGTTTNFGSFTVTNTLPAGQNFVVVSNALTSLTPSTLYYFQPVAFNSAGASFGTNDAFATLITPPGAVTLAASSLTATGATLNGTVDTSGAPTDYYFEFGLTTNYGSFTATNSLVATGSALRFNRDQLQWVVPSQSLNLSNISFSVEFWARRDAINRYDLVLVQGSDGINNQTLHIGWRDNNEFTFAFWGNDLDTPTPQTDTGWHHWACTFDASSLTRIIYRDGVVVASGVASGTYQGSGTFEIAHSNPTGTWFGGCVDDLRIWNEVRSPAQIVAGLASQLTGNEPGLLADWKFDEGSGGVTSNAVPGGGTATLIRGPTWLPSGSPASVSSAISGLLPNTQYHARIVAANSGGSAAGFDVTFTTPAAPPMVLTQPATNITSSSATLNGLINPGQAITTNFFEYGLTTNYGSFSLTNLIPAGADSVGVNATITSLLPGTRYHFRAVAINSAALVAGTDLTFTSISITRLVLENPLLLPNGAFQFTFTNAQGASFNALAAQDLSLGLSNWTSLGPAQEVSPGQYQFTDLQATNYVNRFYMIRSP